MMLYHAIFTMNHKLESHGIAVSSNKTYGSELYHQEMRDLRY